MTLCRHAGDPFLQAKKQPDHSRVVVCFCVVLVVQVAAAEGNKFLVMAGVATNSQETMFQTAGDVSIETTRSARTCPDV